MALDRLTKVDGGGISTTSDYRVGIITASKFVGPFDGSGGNFSGVVTATNGVFSGNISAVDGNFSGNVTIGGTLTYEDVTNIDSVGIITARDGIDCNGDLDVDGHTNLDNVSVAGVSTFTGNVDFSAGVDVLGNLTVSNTEPYILLQDTNNDDDFIIRNTNGVFTIRDATNGADRLTINSNGKTTFPNDVELSSTLTIESTQPTIQLNDTNANDDFAIRNVDGVFGIRDITNGANRFTINSSGEVDIAGNLNAAAGIDVTGNIIASGDITANGGDLTISGVTAVLHLTDTNNDDDFSIMNENGLFIIRDATNSANRISINSSGVVNIPGNTDFGAGIDVVGTIQDTGTTAKIDLTNSGTNATEQAATLYTSNSGTHNRIVIKTYTNGGGDPYIKFDAGGQDMVVGTRYAGTTNNLLVLGPGLDPDTTSGIFVKGNGNIGIAEDNPTRKLDVSGDVLGNAFMLRGNTTASPSIQAQMFRPADNTLAFATDGNNERLRIDSSGHVIIANAGYGTADTNADNFQVKTTSSSSSCGLSILSADNQNSTLYFGNASDSKHAEIVWSDASNLFLIGTSNAGASIKFRTANQSDALTIDSSGHLLPGAAGTQNLGGTSAEWGDVYIADNKKVFLGSDQDFTLHHNNSHAIVKNTTGRLYVLSDNLWFKNQADNSDLARFLNGDQVILYYAGNPKLQTISNGISVTGKVVASGEIETAQDYPNQRPTLDFNFAKTKALDPRLSYVRSGPASYYDDRGLLVLVGDDTPRFDHDPMTRESKGILLEESRRNMQPHSIQYGLNSSDGWVNITSQVYLDYNPGVVTPTGDTIGAITFKDKGGTSQHYITTDVITVSSGTTYTFSFFFKSISGSDANNIKVITGSNLPFEIRSFYFSGVDAGTSTGDDTTLTQLPNGWWRGTYVFTANGNGDTAFYFDLNALNSGAPKNNVMAIYGIQTEIGDFPTSYIPTDGNYAIRGGDTLTMTGSDLTDVFNNLEGTMFYEASLESLTRDNQPIVAFRDISGSTSDYHAMGYAIGGSLGSIRTWFRSNSGNEFLSAHTNNGLNVRSFYKHIYGYKLSDCADAYRTATKSGLIDQAPATGDGNPMITEGLIDELRFGEYYSLGDTLKLDAGHIKRFSYWTQKLTNTQLTTYIS